MRRPRKRLRTFGGHWVPARLMSSLWGELTPEELAEAVEIAKREGRRYIQGLFRGVNGEPAGTVPLRRTRIVQNSDELRGLPDAALVTRIRVKSVVSPACYIQWFMEDYPELNRRWEQLDPDHLYDDPRVAHFCANMEQERRRLLGLPELPTDPDELRALCQEADEEIEEGWIVSARALQSLGPAGLEQLRVMSWDEIVERAESLNPHDPELTVAYAILRRNLLDLAVTAATYDRYPERWSPSGPSTDS